MSESGLVIISSLVAILEGNHYNKANKPKWNLNDVFADKDVVDALSKVNQAER